MSLLDDPVTTPAARRMLLGILLGALALLCGLVVHPFFVPITWAMIVGYASWPAYRLLRRVCHGRHTLAATLMTVLVVLILVVPLIWLAVLLQDEVSAAYQEILSYWTSSSNLMPPFLHTIPWFGDAIQQALDRYAADPLLIRQLLIDWVQRFRTELLGVVGDVGRNIAKLLFSILTVFFIYRDGEHLVRQTAQILHGFFGDRLDRYVCAAGVMTRAVVFGLLITAVVQGTIAGIGYAVFRVEAPIALGVLTALASIVPVVGTFLVWGSAGLALVVTGHLWPGIGLLAWGTLLVHPADNLIRPLLIGKVTQMPFLVVMFGVIGGVAAFGLVGLFIGPVALALAVAVWREWLQERHQAPLPPG